MFEFKTFQKILKYFLEQDFNEKHQYQLGYDVCQQHLKKSDDNSRSLKNHVKFVINTIVCDLLQIQTEDRNKKIILASDYQNEKLFTLKIDSRNFYYSIHPVTEVKISQFNKFFIAYVEGAFDALNQNNVHIVFDSKTMDKQLNDIHFEMEITYEIRITMIF